jgi:hypothetical protein
MANGTYESDRINEVREAIVGESPPQPSQDNGEASESDEAGQSAHQVIFPEAAWRPGPFANYRAALKDRSEASPVVHFGCLVAVCAAALERRIYFPYFGALYPNVFVLAVGPTADKKTSAQRLAVRQAEFAGLRVLRGAGSGEGIADDLQQGPVLISSEEFASIVRPASWQGATLGLVLTECFDCPPRYQRKFRKNRIDIESPTLNLLSATTPEWFWRDARDVDLAGGLGNRLLILDGTAADKDVPLPGMVDVNFVSELIAQLRVIPPTELHLESQAESLWKRFYHAWRRESQKRQTQESLLVAMTRRLPDYALKIGMIYAATEATLPTIKAEQLSAAIQVAAYAGGAAKRLIDLRNAGGNAARDLEERIYRAIRNTSKSPTTKRYVHQSLSKYIPNADAFNRAWDALVRADRIQIERSGGRTWAWAE